MCTRHSGRPRGPGLNLRTLCGSQARGLEERQTLGSLVEGPPFFPPCAPKCTSVEERGGRTTPSKASTLPDAEEAGPTLQDVLAEWVSESLGWSPMLRPEQHRLSLPRLPQPAWLTESGLCSLQLGTRMARCCPSSYLEYQGREFSL